MNSRLSVLAGLWFACFASPLFAQPGPEVWLMPPSAFDGRCFRELFEHPDQWKETATRVNVIGYAK